MRTFGQEVAVEVSNSTAEDLSASYQDIVEQEHQLLTEISDNSERVAQQTAAQTLALDNARAQAQSLQVQNEQLEQAAAAAAEAAAANATQPSETLEEAVPAANETIAESSEEGTIEESVGNSTSTDSTDTEEPTDTSSEDSLPPDNSTVPTSFLQLSSLLSKLYKTYT